MNWASFGKSNLNRTIATNDLQSIEAYNAFEKCTPGHSFSYQNKCAFWTQSWSGK